MKNFAICFTLILFCSCEIHHRIYSSTQINNPSLQKKNDHSFSLAYSIPSGLDLNGGYAITSRFAAIAGAYLDKHKAQEQATNILLTPTSTASFLYHQIGAYGGLGVYLPFSKKKNSGFCSFFAGYAKGSFRMDENSANTYKSNITRYFLQGGITSYDKDFEVSLLYRYSFVAYSKVVTNYTSDEQYYLNFPPLGYSKYSHFLDFGFDSKIYFADKPRMGVQFSFSVTTRAVRKDSNFDYYALRGALGLFVKNPFGKKLIR